MDNYVESELARRTRLLEEPSQQGGDFDTASWIWFGILGVLCPLILIVWGAAT